MKWKMLAAALLTGLLLCGCGGKELPAAETAPAVEQIAEVVTEESLLELNQKYPELKAADLTGSTCYEAIENYIRQNPQVAVTYTVQLGNVAVSPDVAALTLRPEEYDFNLLRENMQYLHSLQQLRLEDSVILPGSIQALRQEYPGVQIEYTVSFCGSHLAGDTTVLDLSAMDPAEVLANGVMLELLPQLQEIQLMTPEGETVYTLEDAAALQQLAPNVLLRYSFELFGKVISTTDEEVIYQNKYIGNVEGNLELLRTALSILRGCDRFVLDNCHFSNEELAAVREEFRGRTKVVWRVWFGEGGCLTDRTVIRHVYGLYDYNSANLIYCEDAEFIDFGHNEILKTCEFLSSMKNLRAIILSGSMISDLSPLANCESLEFLEIAYCGYVTDISPLANCKNLRRLNIAYTKVADLSPLDELEMDVLVDARSGVSIEEGHRFEALHADCLVQHTGDAKDDQPYGYPWRYEQNGDPNEYYALLKEKFGYPNPTNTTF